MAVDMTSGERALFGSMRDKILQYRIPLDLEDKYYDGEARLEQLGLAIPPELQSFTVIANWPRIAVDGRCDRLDEKGFRTAKSDMDEYLWGLWVANRMPENDLMARADYGIFGRSFLSVGVSDRAGDSALITVESPRQIMCERDPRTGRTVAALRLYMGADDSPEDDRATFYLPNITYWLELSPMGWQVVKSNRHNLGEVPVIPAYRSRRSAIPAWNSYKMQGTSAMTDVIPISDSAARNLTNVQVAQETHAVPARYAIGVSKGDFVDSEGNPLPAWEAYFGAISATANPKAQFGQFSSSDMRNFETMLNMYARQAAALAVMPPDYFGLPADDAASADAIRSREARLVKQVERDQKALGYARAEAVRLAAKLSGKTLPATDRVETLWYDAGTPTFAQRADAVQKLWSATNATGEALLPTRMAREELGWSPERIQRAEAMDAEARARADEYLRDTPPNPPEEPDTDTRP